MLNPHFNITHGVPLMYILNVDGQINLEIVNDLVDWWTVSV